MTKFVSDRIYNESCFGTSIWNAGGERRWNVYYELYIDVLFLVNFMMDYLILLVVKKITKCSTTQVRIFLASMIGSLLTCVVILLPIPYELMNFLLFHVFINILMIKIGFVIKDKGTFVKCLISLYVAGVLLSGVFQYIGQYLEISSLFFFVAIISYGMVQGICGFMDGISKEHMKWYEVEVYLENQMIRIKALLDTGNSLYDPFAGKAVSIVERKNFCDAFNIDMRTEENMVKYQGRYIPFHSLGNQGIMLAITVRKLHICGTKDLWIENPRIALSEEILSESKSYEMILNPDIL